MTNTKYCFICILNAQKTGSGLACRMPVLWEELSRRRGNTVLVINQSLYEKTISKNGPHQDVFIVRPVLGFKMTSALVVPFIVIWLFFRGFRKFHLSAGGTYFIRVVKTLNLLRRVQLHSSLGSRSIEMAADLVPREMRHHEYILKNVDVVDCLYSGEGFRDWAYKVKTAPGSFSWRYSSAELRRICSTPFVKRNRILYSGNLTTQKNYSLAIDSVEQLVMQSGRVDLELEIFAAVKSVEILRRAAEVNARVGYDLVKFPDYSLIDMSLSEAYIFLSLQNIDNYPSQSLIEAMAHGCTIIATDVGETRKMVKAENGNYLVDATVESIACALSQAFGKEGAVNSLNQAVVSDEGSVESYAEYFSREFIDGS